MVRSLRISKPKITPVQMFSEVIRWARFSKQLMAIDQVDTIYGCKADVLAVSMKTKLSYEIEVKCTNYDLAVLEKKKTKWRRGKPTVTDYFYVAVPEHLTAAACETFDKQYGILVVYGVGDRHPNVVVHRSARKLTYSKKYSDVLYDILMRVSSVRAISHVDNYFLELENNRLKSQVENLTVALNKLIETK